MNLYVKYTRMQYMDYQCIWFQLDAFLILAAGSRSGGPNGWSARHTTPPSFSLLFLL